MNEMRVEQSVGLTRKLAEFAISFKLQSAPPIVVQNAKLAILDCLGVSILALPQEIGQATIAFAREHACCGSCTIWGTGLTASGRDAAFCNGVLSHGLDFDDRNHSSTFTLAASMAITEQYDLPGMRALEAFIVGREVRNSLDKLFSDRNSGVGPGARGWHSNGILGPIAAACSAGNALRLGREQMLAAIGLAAGSCGALTRDGGTMAKPFRTGQAAATGLTCVLLAKSDFSADETILEGQYGLLDALSPLPNDAVQSLGKDLGNRFELANEIKSKPIASCTATHSATEAMVRLRHEHDIDPQAVASIECDLKPYPLVRQHPTRGYEGRFSLPFCLAIALIRGRLNPDDFVDQNIRDPVVRDLIQKTKHTPGAGSLVVRSQNGGYLSENLTRPSNYGSLDQITDKFHRCTDELLTAARANKVVQSIKDLHRLTSVRQLTRLLQSP